MKLPPFPFIQILIGIPRLTKFVAASDPRYSKFEHLLVPGWISGRMVVSAIPDRPSLRVPRPGLTKLAGCLGPPIPYV